MNIPVLQNEELFNRFTSELLLIAAFASDAQLNKIRAMVSIGELSNGYVDACNDILNKFHLKLHPFVLDAEYSVVE